MNAQQIATLRAAVLAEPTLATARANADDMAIAAWLNEQVVDKCWLTSLTTAQVHEVMDWDEYIARSVAEKAAFTCMFSLGEVNPSKANIRTGFANIFSGTATRTVNFRTALLAAAQRTMTRAEKLLATGPTSGAYVLAFEGDVSYSEASEMR